MEKMKITFVDMPTKVMAHQTKGKSHTIVDVVTLRELLMTNLEHCEYDACYVEKTVSPSTVTAKSRILIQGKNIGMGEAIVMLSCHDEGIPYFELSPQKWKNKTGLVGRDKKSCVIFGEKHTPVSEHFKFWGKQGGLKDGRGDAFCIAYAGNLVYNK